MLKRSLQDWLCIMGFHKWKKFWHSGRLYRECKKCYTKQTGYYAGDGTTVWIETRQGIKGERYE